MTRLSNEFPEIYRLLLAMGLRKTIADAPQPSPFIGSEYYVTSGERSQENITVASRSLGHDANKHKRQVRIRTWPTFYMGKPGPGQI